MAAKALKLLRLKLITLAFSVLFLVSLYVLLLRTASLFLEDYRGDLEQYLSSQTEQTIEIHKIRSVWRGLDPTLVIHGMSVNGRHNAYLGRVRIQVSFWESLRNLQPSIKEVLIEHTEITMEQFEDGAWSVASSPIDLKAIFESDQTHTTSQDTDFLEVLLGKATLHINDMTLSLHNKQGLVQSLRVPGSSLNYHNNNVYLSGSVRETDGANALLSFSLEGYNVIGDSKPKTSLYIEARSAEFFGKLLQVYSWEQLSIEDVSASTRAWFEFDGVNLQSIQGDLQLFEMNWRAGLSSAPPIRNLAFNYLWKASDETGVLSINDLNYSWLDRVCSTEALNIEVSAKISEVSLSSVDLFCVSQLAVATGLLPVELHDRLEVSRPDGSLQKALLTLDHTQDAFNLEAELEQVALEAYEGTPSASGIDGFLYSNQEGGFVSFSSQGFELGFPDLFLQSWQMHKAEGYVEWRIKGEDVDVFSDGLRLWQRDGGLVYGDFALYLNGSEHEDYLDLSIALQDLIAPRAPSFVPFHIVGADLHDWLVDSLQSGTVSSGIYLGHGSIEGDDSENSFTSSIDLNTTDLSLKFDPLWPLLTQLDANINLQNEELFISAPSAYIAGTKLTGVEATMLTPKENASSILRVESATQADALNLNYWLSESPISEYTKAISDQLDFEGLLDVEVSLDIPVSEGEDNAELAYFIRSQLKNMKVSHHDSGIQFDQVDGVLDVSSSHGVTGEGIKVIAFGEPATLEISTEFDTSTYSYLANGHEHDEFEDLSQTNIKLAGETDILQIFKFFGYQTAAFMEGKFPYTAELYLPNHKHATPSVDIRSSLKGLRRDWPAPLNKHVDQKEDFFTRIKIKPSEMLVLTNLRLNNDQTLDSELLFFGGELSFGEISLNGAAMDNPALDGLNIVADLGEMNASSWVGFIDKLTKLPWNDEKSEESLIKKVQLDVATLDALSYQFNKTRLEVFPDKDYWNLDLKGEDAIGVVRLPHAASPILADFSLLSLKEKAGEGMEKSAESEVDPRLLPDVDFSVASLALDGRMLGAWQGSMKVNGEGAIISDISGKIKGSNFSGQLNWQVLEDEIQNSILTFKGEGKHFENVFRLIGLDPLVSSDDFSSNIALTWPGPPMDFSLANTSGLVELLLKDGFMQTDDEKTGALRLFGVLNAEAIMRRLKLDFSDLYKSGVGFDSLSLNASIDQGLLTLTEALVVDGPAGKYTINGASDLASKSLDFDMLVELPFSQNVPLAALVLGAPQIGGLVWLADKLLGEPLSALTTARYDITGSWEEPVIELKEAVNASKKKRSKGNSPNRITPSEEVHDSEF